MFRGGCTEYVGSLPLNTQVTHLTGAVFGKRKFARIPSDVIKMPLCRDLNDDDYRRGTDGGTAFFVILPVIVAIFHFFCGCCFELPDAARGRLS